MKQSLLKPIQHCGGTLALAALLTAAAHAQLSAEGDGPAPSDEALIERVAGDGVRIESRFDGPPGLTGYVLDGAVEGGGESQSRPVVVWVTEAPRQLIVGNVFDAWGRNLTNVAGEAERADNPITQLMESTIRETWARAEQTHAENEAAAEPSAPSRSEAAPESTPEAPWGAEHEDVPSPADPADESALIAEAKEAEPSAAAPSAPSNVEPDGGMDRQARIEAELQANNGVIRDGQIIAEAVGGVRALREYGSVITEQRAHAPTAARVGIYFDPRCGFCEQFAERLDTDRLGDAQVDWIPVGLLESTEAAEQMLADGEPGAAVRAIDRGPARLDETPADVTEDDSRGVAANEQVLADTLLLATPIVVIEHPDPESERIEAVVHVGMTAEGLMETLDPR